MTNRLSRRQILGIGAGSLAAGAARPEAGHAKSHEAPPRGRAEAADGRAYWQKSFSGGPINVAPLAPGLPGDHYKPVVVPNGAALPFRIVIKVRDELESYDADPGWYQHPSGTVALEATEAELTRDGIEVKARP